MFGDLKYMPRRSNSDDGEITANFWNTKDADTFIPSSVKAESLPAGRFVVEKDYNDILNFKRVKDEFASIVYNPTAQGKLIISDVQMFWDRKDFFAEKNITQRMGILLFGVQGCGKSVILQHIIKQTIQGGGVVFQGTPFDGNYDSFVEGLRTFRKIEPNRPLVCVYEEIDKLVDKAGDSQILGILDGESSINHVLNIATTNHPDKLDPTLINRPRRFDRLIEVGFPDKETRTIFYEGKGLQGDELELWVTKTQDLSFAAMTELFVLVKAYNKTFEESLARMKRMMTDTPKLEKFKKSIGFGA